MPDPSGAGKVTSSVDDGVLTIRRPTYRRGDIVHVIFASLAVVFALLFLFIALMNRTLLANLTIPLVILALGAYGYFGLTRVVNRRTVRISQGRLTASDGPVPQIGRRIDRDLEVLTPFSVESSTRFTFPVTTTYRIYRVDTRSGPDLFRRLPTEGEADYVLATIEAFTG
jgi:hypothetical protein